VEKKRRAEHDSCRVSFVGAGPGDPELITVKGKRCIMEADLVLYAGSLVPAEVVSCARSGARVLDSSSMTLEEIHEAIVAVVRSGGRVARVHTGDPSLYGAIKEQMRLLDRDRIPYQVIPGVTAGFAAAAAAKVSLTVPEATQTVIFTRAAGTTPVPPKEELKGLASHQCTIVLYLSASRVDEVAKALRDGGYPLDTTVVVGYRIGWSDETILLTCLSRLAEEVKEKGISKQAVFLVLPGEKGEGRSRLYDPAFSHGFRQGKTTRPQDEEG